MKLSEKFIKANNLLCDMENHVNAPYLRKKFMLDFKPSNAQITICGLGFYELYINGKNITKGALAPYISNTDDICYYDNYDITDLLNEGENVVGIILGNGFRNPFGGFVWDFEKSAHRGCVCTALYLESTDGKNSFEMEADESFKTHPSPILFDDLRMGYHYDSRLEIQDWNSVDFDDSAWDNAMYEKTPNGEKKLCTVEPINVIEEIKPVDIKHYDSLPFAYENTAPGAKPVESTYRNNVYVYDFGINGAGVSKLKINGRPGQKITIRHAEHLIDGKFAENSIIFDWGYDNPKNAMITDYYLEYAYKDVFICKGGEEEFIPKFKYDGFRYVMVEGLDKEQATKDAVTFMIMNSDVEARADFECSDEILNKLQKCTRRADLSNLFYFPTDCPHREKNGWTGDASVSAEHMLLNLKAGKTLGEWLANIRKAQNEQGALPGIVPTGGWGFEWGNGPAWDAVCVNLPYYIYKFDGDKKVIEENAEMIMRYLCYVMTRRDERGLIEIGLGDWQEPFQEQNGKISSPLCFTDSAMIYDIANKAQFLFEQIGRKREAQYAKLVSEEMRSAIRKNLIDFDTMTVAGDCQTSQAVALETGLFAADEIEAARKRLVEIVHRDGDINACGMIGLRYIFHALINSGEADLAYEIITSNNRTCYGYWIEKGETSLCESFKPYEHIDVDSRNHHFLGDISSTFIQEFAGIKPNPTMTDINSFEISPQFISKLSYASAYYDAPKGRVELKWERTDGGIKINLSVPCGTYGKIVLPKGYTFEDGKNEKEWSGNLKTSTYTYFCKN